MKQRGAVRTLVHAEMEKHVSHSKQIQELRAEIDELRSNLELRNQTACDRLVALQKLESEIERLKAEIQRLVAINAEMTAAALKEVLDGQKAEIESGIIEIKRLQAELERALSPVRECDTL